MRNGPSAAGQKLHRELRKPSTTIAECNSGFHLSLSVRNNLGFIET